MAGQRRTPGKRLRHWLEAALLLGLLRLARAFDLDTASAIGGRLGRLASGLMRQPSTIANVRIAFPELGDAQVTALIRDMGENLGRTVAESGHLEKFTGEAGRQRFAFHGQEHLDAARAAGKPLLIVSGHFGNWELVFPAMHHLGIDAAGITRRPNNPHVADWFERNRSRLGFTVQIPKGSEGTRQMMGVFRRGGDVAMLVDQHLAQGLPAPLFGQPAMTVHSPAILALEHGVTVLPLAVRREAGARFSVHVHPALAAPKTGNAASDVLAMTAALNAFVETEVRARPAHWLWMHRRWKPVSQFSRRAARLLHEAGVVVARSGVH